MLSVIGRIRGGVGYSHPRMPVTISCRNVQERAGGETELVAHIRRGGGQETDPGCVTINGQEAVETGFHAAFARQPAHAPRHVGKRALRLLHCEQSELKERFAGHRREEVRIAPASVEHHPFGVTACQFRQIILEFERAQGQGCSTLSDAE